MEKLFNSGVLEESNVMSLDELSDFVSKIIDERIKVFEKISDSQLLMLRDMIMAECSRRASDQASAKLEIHIPKKMPVMAPYFAHPLSTVIYKKDCDDDE